MDPDAILADLNGEHSEAATATTGPVVILAGAGTGKTRVISHRAAYAAATGRLRRLSRGSTIRAGRRP